MPEADAELVQKTTQKDQQAFEQLFSRYNQQLFRFVCYLTQSRAEAEDLFQETWLRVVRYLSSTSELRDFKAWLFTIAVNLHRDEIRKRRLRRMFFSHRSVQSDLDEETKDDSERAVVPSVSHDPDRLDLTFAIRQAIAKLPPRQRRVFVLKEVEGFKHEEIGEMLGIPVGTAKSLLHRAVKRLQRELAVYRTP